MLHSINPSFIFGGSSVHSCDCIGLLILKLKSEGFTCPWETYLKRNHTTYFDLGRLSIKYGANVTTVATATKVRKMKASGNNVYFCLFDVQGMGHIGVLEFVDGVAQVFHMTHFGMRVLPAEGLAADWFVYKGE